MCYIVLEAVHRVCGVHLTRTQCSGRHRGEASVCRSTASTLGQCSTGQHKALGQVTTHHRQTDRQTDRQTVTDTHPHPHRQVTTQQQATEPGAMLQVGLTCRAAASADSTTCSVGAKSSWKTAASWKKSEQKRYSEVAVSISSLFTLRNSSCTPAGQLLLLWFVQVCGDMQLNMHLLQQ